MEERVTAGRDSLARTVQIKCGGRDVGQGGWSGMWGVVWVVEGGKYTSYRNECVIVVWSYFQIGFQECTTSIAIIGQRSAAAQVTMLPAILSAALLLLHPASVTAKSQTHRPVVVGGCGQSSGPDIDHASAVVYITQANKWIVSGACDEGVWRGWRVEAHWRS